MSASKPSQLTVDNLLIFLSQRTNMKAEETLIFTFTCILLSVFVSGHWSLVSVTEDGPCARSTTGSPLLCRSLSHCIDRALDHKPFALYLLFYNGCSVWLGIHTGNTRWSRFTKIFCCETPTADCSFPVGVGVHCESGTSICGNAGIQRCSTQRQRAHTSVDAVGGR